MVFPGIWCDRSRKRGTVALPSFPKEMSQAVLFSHTWPGKETALSGDQHTGPYIRGTLSLSGHGRIWGLAKTREGEPRGCVNTSRIRVVDGGLGGDSPWLNARGEIDSHALMPWYTLVRLPLWRQNTSLHLYKIHLQYMPIWVLMRNMVPFIIKGQERHKVLSLL